MTNIYSPLRYPGGKGQLYSFVYNLIELNKLEGGVYIEPFAGGAGIPLRLVAEGKMNEVIINDLDKSIHSFWYSALNHTEDIVKMIKQTPITISEWKKQKEIYEAESQNPYSLLGGFATLFLNRTNVNGVLKGGPIGGYNQSNKYKIDCRFPKDTLIKRIQRIAKYKEKIILSNLDANDLIVDIKSKYSPENIFIFFDPPYYKQGKNLYLKFNNEEQHLELANSVMEMEEYLWILTYDISEEIFNYYKDLKKKYTYQLRYSATKDKSKAKEFLFSSEMTVIDSFNNVVLKPFD